MQCPSCNYDIPTRQCNGCGRENPMQFKFCGHCGTKIKVLLEGEAAGAAPKERTACSDGACIGIIGEGNLCVVCGKQYSGPAK